MGGEGGWGERFKRPIDFREFVTSPFSEGPAELQILTKSRTICAQQTNKQSVRRRRLEPNLFVYKDKATFRSRWDTGVTKAAKQLWRTWDQGPRTLVGGAGSTSFFGGLWLNNEKPPASTMAPSCPRHSVADRLWGHVRPVRAHPDALHEIGVLVTQRWGVPQLLSESLNSLMVWRSVTLLDSLFVILLADVHQIFCQLVEWSGVSQQQLSTLVLVGTRSFLLAAPLKSCPMKNKLSACVGTRYPVKKPPGIVRFRVLSS